MGLPQIAVPSFITKLPSTGQEIEYRPFLVKEEKILLMALEGDDSREISNSVMNILESCLITDIDVSSLPTFDVEYLFLQLRSKSVGEVITLMVGHTFDTDCKSRTEIQLDLNTVKVVGVKKEEPIMLEGDIGVKMKYPTTELLAKIQSSQNIDDIMDTVAGCVQYAFDKDDVYDDFTIEEMVEWLGGLKKDQFNKIQEFFTDAPKLQHKLGWVCEKCGEKDEIQLEGLQSFFI